MTDKYSAAGTQTMARTDLCLTPGMERAAPVDWMGSRLVTALALQQGGQLNLRRDFNTLMPIVGRHLVWPQAVLARVRAFLARRCVGNESWRGHEALTDAEFLERHGVWRGAYEEGTLFFYVDEYAKDQPKDLLAVLACTHEWLNQALKGLRTHIDDNIDALAKLMQLNTAERALLQLGTLARSHRDMRGLLIEFKVQNAAEAYARMAQLAGVKADELADALRPGSRLERLGLLDNLIAEHSITDLGDLMKVSDKVPAVLMREYNDQAELMAVFTRLAEPTELGATDFAYVSDDLQVLSNLLRRAADRHETGINVLLYGPPGTGKTALAKVVARSCGLKLFEVEHSDRDGNALSGRDRYRSLQVAQAFLKGSADAVLLFDEVEDVFPPVTGEAAQWLARADQSPGSASVSGKAWVNQVLENNPVPTVWITNRIEQIDPAFRRRFAYHLELKSPPPGAREALIRKAVQNAQTDAHGGELMVSEAFVEQLTQRQGLTPAQIGTALRFAKLVHGDATGADGLEKLVRRQLDHADKALGHADTVRGARPTITTYDLSMLNVESRHDVPRIVEALKARGHGTLCFYGPPGTGKTALGEHIAQALDKPLIIKQASDLMSKYVGETEKSMAAMFRDAEVEQAVLLLDEADSFLQDRRGAQRSYEVTEVNEMLQGMERFRGIFICTTNLLDRIDQAALRRFAFKIQFKPLTNEQRERMFVTEALSGDTAQLSVGLRARLAKLTQLCPGDFAAVKRQVDILATVFTPDEFMEQLEAEHRIKPEVRETRSMGFLGVDK